MNLRMFGPECAGATPARRPHNSGRGWVVYDSKPATHGRVPARRGQSVLTLVARTYCLPALRPGLRPHSALADRRPRRAVPSMAIYTAGLAGPGIS